jgi:hypothetical protein
MPPTVPPVSATDILKSIHDELVAIRQLLAAKPAAPAAAAPRPATSASDPIVVPQPSEIIANPGDVTIHFGKNNGVALSTLGERSLSWYAQEQAPRLDSSGQPYPARPQEINLRNAARTLWHTNKGTLVGAAPAAPAADAGADWQNPKATDDGLPF